MRKNDRLRSWGQGMDRGNKKKQVQIAVLFCLPSVSAMFDTRTPEYSNLGPFICRPLLASLQHTSHYTQAGQITVIQSFLLPSPAPPIWRRCQRATAVRPAAASGGAGGPYLAQRWRTAAREVALAERRQVWHGMPARRRGTRVGPEMAGGRPPVVSGREWYG